MKPKRPVSSKSAAVRAARVGAPGLGLQLRVPVLRVDEVVVHPRVRHLVPRVAMPWTAPERERLREWNLRTRGAQLARRSEKAFAHV